MMLRKLIFASLLAIQPAQDDSNAPQLQICNPVAPANEQILPPSDDQGDIA
jgi:hypothetical protein